MFCTKCGYEIKDKKSFNSKIISKPVKRPLMKLVSRVGILATLGFLCLFIAFEGDLNSDKAKYIETYKDLKRDNIKPSEASEYGYYEYYYANYVLVVTIILGVITYTTKRSYIKGQEE